MRATPQRSRTKTRARLTGSLGIVLGLSVLAPFGPARPAAAATACDRWMAPAGSDANDGTAARPWQSLRKLAGSLGAGQTGCLTPGTHQAQGNAIIAATGGRPGAPVTITSGPGGRARLVGQIHVQATAADLVLTGLTFDGAPAAPKGTLLNVDGDRVTVSDSDITNPWGICVDVGAIDAYSHAYRGDRADGFRLERNHIHHCGMSPSLVWTPGDSGVHGVYLINTDDTRVTENLIYANRWRGLQTWPKAERVLVADNLFDGNATHVNVGSALTSGYPWHSRDVVVRDNVMSNRVTDFRPDKNMAQVQGNFPAGPTYGNLVTGNCLATAGPHVVGNGLERGPNATGDARYLDRGVADFRLQPTSPCVGTGPRSIQPGTPPAGADLSVALAATVSGTTGAETVHTLTVSSRGPAVASGARVSLTLPAGIVALAAPAGCQAGTTVTCTLGDLGPAASATRRVTTGVTRPGTLSATASVSSATSDPSPANNRATATTTATGPACTMVGTAGHDTLNGTAGADVICTFGGNDTVMPGRGDDRFLAGSGVDGVSYWNLGAPVVLNLGHQSAWDPGATEAVGWDVFSSVEWAYGSAFADLLVGSPGADRILGLEGADRLHGYEGDDVLLGGVGDDSLDGGAGNDACQQDAGTGPRTACEA